MSRLKFALCLCLALGAPAAAAPGASPPVDPKVPAGQLFSDPVERETFLVMMSSTPALTAAVSEAERAALLAGGADAAAVAAELNKNPAAAGWRQGVVDALKDARKALAAGLAPATPQTEYPDTPLVGELIKRLNKQNAADLFVSLNVPKYDGAPPPAPPVQTPPPCPTGTSRKAMTALMSSAASGNMGAVTGDCQPDAPAPPHAQPPVGDPTQTPTPPAVPTTAARPPVSDQHPTTGPPPSPTDKDSSGGSGGMFSSLPWDRMKMGAGFGAAIGMLMAFGTPVGLIGGAVIGAVVGGALFSGLIGKLFGN